jgi:hypothetical protein
MSMRLGFNRFYNPYNLMKEPHIRAQHPCTQPWVHVKAFQEIVCAQQETHNSECAIPWY